MSSVTVSSPVQTPAQDDESYSAFLKQLQVNFLQRAAAANGVIFNTDAEDPFGHYLNNLPIEVRQHYSCNACHTFLHRFGKLVAINPAGKTFSLFWDETTVADFLKPAVKKMREIVEAARIINVFHHEEKVWGLPRTGVWHHMAVIPPKEMVYHRSKSTTKLMDAYQFMAQKRQDKETLSRALAEFTDEALAKANALLVAKAVKRPELSLAHSKWLIGVKTKLNGVPSRVKENLLWKTVAEAPVGFCAPRGSLLGSMIQDILEGKSEAAIIRGYDEKADPTLYRRATSAPSAGNIKAAEMAFEALGAGPALERRFMKLEEAKTVWTPAPAPADSGDGGLFGHLKAKDEKPKAAPEITKVAVVTWVKFARDVLPHASKIDFVVRNRRERFCALTTAVNAQAVPLMQWDEEDNRNPACMYMGPKGGTPEQWNLVPKTLVEVTGITLRPNLWTSDKYVNRGVGVIFLLKGCVDTQYERVGRAIYPETLRSEYHPYRSTIEAFSNSGTLSGVDQATACGIFTADDQVDSSAPVFLVKMDTGATIPYQIDRWE